MTCVGHCVQTHGKATTWQAAGSGYTTHSFSHRLSEEQNTCLSDTCSCPTGVIRHLKPHPAPALCCHGGPAVPLGPQCLPPIPVLLPGSDIHILECSPCPHPHPHPAGNSWGSCPGPGRAGPSSSSSLAVWAQPPALAPAAPGSGVLSPSSVCTPLFAC